MNKLQENELNRSIDFPFRIFQHQIIHSWSLTLTALAFILVPLFFILDYFTMPKHFLYKFAIYRLIATTIPLMQYFILKKTEPGRLSTIHGYIVSLVVGGVIAVMTVDLGGFDSGYYAGIILVIIGVNLLLPWGAAHSAANGLMLLLAYITLNLIFPNSYRVEILISNLFFMTGTVIIAVSINHVRFQLIRQEFNLRAELRKARDAIWSEMELAKKIQTIILPKNVRLGNYQMAAVMKPADEVGGDYYDFFETETGQKWVTIGDVSGHGVDSGLIMTMTQTSIFSVLNRTYDLTPSEMLDHVNSVIRKNLSRLDVKRYMTLSAIKLCDKKIITAGKHQDILILRSRDQSVEVINTSGTWIGIVDDLESFMTDQEIAIHKGDIILLYTDGATEATAEDGEMYGEERLIDSLKKNSILPLDNMIGCMLNEILDFQKEQDDDITLLAIKKMF